MEKWEKNRMAYILVCRRIWALPFAILALFLYVHAGRNLWNLYCEEKYPLIVQGNIRESETATTLQKVEKWKEIKQVSSYKKKNCTMGYRDKEAQTLVKAVDGEFIEDALICGQIYRENTAGCVVSTQLIQELIWGQGKVAEQKGKTIDWEDWIGRKIEMKQDTQSLSAVYTIRGIVKARENLCYVSYALLNSTKEQGKKKDVSDPAFLFRIAQGKDLGGVIKKMEREPISILRSDKIHLQKRSEQKKKMWYKLAAGTESLFAFLLLYYFLGKKAELPENVALEKEADGNYKKIELWRNICLRGHAFFLVAVLLGMAILELIYRYQISVLHFWA